MHVEGVEATTAAMVAELPADGPPRARFCHRLALQNPFEDPVRLRERICVAMA